MNQDRRKFLAAAAAAAGAGLAGCGDPEGSDMPDPPTPPETIQDGDPATVYLMESMRWQNGRLSGGDPNVEKPELDFNYDDYTSDWRYILESVEYQNEHIENND